MPCVLQGVSELHSVKVNLVGHIWLLRRTQRCPDWCLIAGLCTLNLRDLTIPVAPNRALPIDEEQLASFRSSYRGLSYSLAHSGHTVNNDLPGNNRSEMVAALRVPESMAERRQDLKSEDATMVGARARGR